jgi:predicted RND superfamily exporter protein
LLPGRLLDPFVRVVLARPGVWLWGCCALTLALSLGLLRLEVRTDGAAIHPLGDPTIALHRADQLRFHERDQIILLVSSPSEGQRIDSPEGLRFLKQLHEALAGGPGSETRMRSIANLIDPQPEIMVVRSPDFLADIPEDPEGEAALLRRIDASPLARGLYLAPSGHAAAFYIAIGRHTDRDQLVTILEHWAHDHARGDFSLRLTGPVTAEVLLGRVVLRDLARLVPLVVLAMAVLLFACTRSVAGVVVPLAEVLMVLLCTLGVMGVCGVPITLVTTILPVLLVTIAVTDEIHLLERFREYWMGAVDRASLENPPGAAERRKAILGAVRDVGRPIVLTSLTTSIGFLSFLSASILPIRHLGVFTALGVLFAMVLSFSFVPALLCVLPASWFREWPDRRRVEVANTSRGIERLIIRHDTRALVLALALLLVCAPGLLRLSIQDSWVDNFDPSGSLASAERDFNREFWGSYRFDVVLTSTRPRYFHTAAGLRLIQAATRVAEASPQVGGVANHRMAYQTLADVWDERAPVDELGAERIAEISRLLSRVQQRIDLDQVLLNNGSSARIRLFVKSADHARGHQLQAHLENELPTLLEPAGVQFRFGGDLPVAQVIVDSIVGNVLRSLGWTLLGVFALLFFLYRDLRRASITATPLLVGIVILVGGMGYVAIPFGIATSLFVAVTIGVAIDFSIHFVHAYSLHSALPMPHGGSRVDHETALRATFVSAGRAIRWNAVVLALGLAVLGLSELKPNRNLGLLLVAAISVCYAITLFALPRLLRIGTDSDPTLRFEEESDPEEYQ